jgi:hypothetical protein
MIASKIGTAAKQMPNMEAKQVDELIPSKIALT